MVWFWVGVRVVHCVHTVHFVHQAETKIKA